MATNTISPNMALVIPTIGVEPGPQYASDINSSLTILDAHTHAIGSGVQITPAAININIPLAMNNNALISIKALTLTPQTVTPADDSIYVNGVDLWFVDGSGNNVRITAGGTVNATSSGISSGTATAAFVGGVLVVNAAANTPANIQAASYLMGNNIAASNYLTLSPPNAMAVSYTLTLPSLPSSTSFMLLDVAGNMSSTTFANLGTTMGAIGANSIGVAMTATGANAVQASRTMSVLNIAPIGGLAINSPVNFSTNSGVFVVSPVTLTLTTSGRPVMIMLSSDGSATPTSLSNIGGKGSIMFFNQTTNLIIGSYSWTDVVAGNVSAIDTFISGTPGSYTYNVYLRVDSGGLATSFNNARVTAYEL